MLCQAGEDVLSQLYDPSANGNITINLKEVIHGRLATLFKDLSESYEQTRLAAEFIAIVNDTEIKFKVVRGGVDRLADSATNFLTQNVLTWQPQIKPVTYYSPEFLTYYAVTDATVRLKAYFTSGDEETTSREIDIVSIPEGRACTIPLQYAVVAGLLNGSLPSYYDVWVENSYGYRLTYVQRYYASDMASEQEDWILFENSMGGIDTFRAHGNMTFTGEHTHNLAEVDEVTTEYRVDTERKFKKNTGFLDVNQRKWLLDFFPSGQKYIYVGNCFRQIVVTESNVEYAARELPGSYTFTYKYADAKPLLNLPRTDIPADVLHISVPDIGSFTVPPRLSEFPRLPLSEGALFPVQNPYSEEWTTTTIAAIATYLLSTMVGTGNGILSETQIRELIAAIGGEMFLRKDRQDATQFLVRFMGGITAGKYQEGHTGASVDQEGNAEFNKLLVRLAAVFRSGLKADHIQSTDYSSGALGEGFLIRTDPATGKSYIEVDELFVRVKALFSELEIKKLSYAGGNYLFTAAGMKCAEVEEHDTFWRCYLTVDDGETAIGNPFREGDQVQYQEFNIKPGVYENVSNRYYWRLCVGAGDDYIDISKTDCDADSNAPRAGDSLVQLGNRTDKARQNAIILSVYGDDAPSIRQYAGIDSYSLAGKDVTAISPQGNRFTGDFILKTGINIMTRFEILENMIRSEISSVRDEVQAKDNYLRNSAFASNTDGWDTVNDIRLFTVSGMFLLLDDAFHSRKDAMAAVIRYGDRNVLRVIGSGIRQANADLADKPDYAEGESPRKFFISFRYKVSTAGTLTVGFTGQDLHFTERLEPGGDYAMKEYSGTWDGTGDFELRFTGDIYIHSLAVTDNAYEDLVARLETGLSQTDEKIEAVAKRTTNLEERSAGWITTADGNKLWAGKEEFGSLSERSSLRFSQIEQRAESIELSVTEIGDSIKDIGIKIDGINDEISLFVKKDDIINAINVSDEGITINANKINLEAYTPKKGVIAAINLGDEGIKISAEKIDISGAVTFDSLNSTLQNVINEKVSSSSLGGLAYEDAIEASLLGSTIIVGGYLNSNFIKVNALETGLVDGEAVITIDSWGFRINTRFDPAVEIGTESVSNTYGGYIIIRDFVRLTSPYCKLSASGLVFYKHDGSVDRYY